MTNVLSAVRSYLLAVPSVSDGIGQRMYLDRLKQGPTIPAATITKVSQTPAHTLSDLAGMTHTRLQIECISLSRLTSDELAESMITSGIARVKGETHGVDIRGVMIEDGQRNFTIDDSRGGDDHTYVTQFDLMVAHRS